MVLKAGGNTSSISPAPVRDLYILEYDRLGQWMPNREPYNVLQYMYPVFPALPGNYDDTKPGILLDGGRSTFNMNGVDWSGDNAGTDERYFDIDIVIYVDAGQKGEYSIWPASDGDDNRVMAHTQDNAQVCKLNGRGEAESILSTFRLKLSDAPRAGESDWFRIWMKPTISNPDSMDGFYIHGARCSFTLPWTFQNDYRVCHVHAWNDGNVVSNDLDSIDRVDESGAFLHFWNDKHQDVLMQKVHDTAGFWFQAAKPCLHDYELMMEGGGKLTLTADDLPFSVDRLYVKRGGHVEGWVNASLVKYVRVTR